LETFWASSFKVLRSPLSFKLNARDIISGGMDPLAHVNLFPDSIDRPLKWPVSNFWGPLHLIQVALETLKRKRQETIESPGMTAPGFQWSPKKKSWPDFI
jgi:hypothetical protein